MEITTKQKALKWWNSLGKIKQDDLAMDYFGSTLMMDSEIEQIWLREVPPVKMYTEDELKNAFEAGMNCPIAGATFEEYLTIIK